MIAWPNSLASGPYLIIFTLFFLRQLMLRPGNSTQKVCKSTEKLSYNKTTLDIIHKTQSCQLAWGKLYTGLKKVCTPSLVIVTNMSYGLAMIGAFVFLVLCYGSSSVLHSALPCPLRCTPRQSFTLIIRCLSGQDTGTGLAMIPPSATKAARCFSRPWNRTPGGQGKEWPAKQRLSERTSPQANVCPFGFLLDSLV